MRRARPVWGHYLVVDRPPARIVGLIAQAAPVIVVFRRGPSDWTAAYRWDVDTDEVVLGDWFRGRLYVRRTDLSPCGDRLVYFAANFRSARQLGFPYGYAWTAASEPPSLQPIVFWAKDDCWFGGGLFATERLLELNERGGHAQPAIPIGLHVRYDPEARGEDEPLYGRRLQRDGYVLTQPLETGLGSAGFVTTTPEIRRKASSHGSGLQLTRIVEGYADVHRYSCETAAGSQELAGFEWADFDQRGRVVGARGGKLLAAPINENLDFEVIADLNSGEPPG